MTITNLTLLKTYLFTNMKQMYLCFRKVQSYKKNNNFILKTVIVITTFDEKIHVGKRLFVHFDGNPLYASVYNMLDYRNGTTHISKFFKKNSLAPKNIHIDYYAKSFVNFCRRTKEFNEAYLSRALDLNSFFDNGYISNDNYIKYNEKEKKIHENALILSKYISPINRELILNARCPLVYKDITTDNMQIMDIKDNKNDWKTTNK